MKPTKTFIVLMLWMAFLSSAFSADPPKGYFNLKEGDWFEMKFTGGGYLNHVFPIKENKTLWGFENKRQKFLLELYLRYKLLKHFPNDVQQYEVSIHRIVEKSLHVEEGVLLGYDSYYPPFNNANNYPVEKIRFIMEVSPAGDIIKFESVFTGPMPSFHLYEIGPKLKYNFTMRSTGERKAEWFKIFCEMVTLPPNESLFKKIKSAGDTLVTKVEAKHHHETEALTISHFMVNDSVLVDFLVSKKTGIPVRIGKTLLMTKASFPVPENTLIKGRVTDLVDQPITISLKEEHLKDEAPQSFFETKKFRTNSDGSFHCPIFLARPLRLEIKVGEEKSLTTFMEPGDTLDISGIGQLIEQVSPRGEIAEETIPQEFQNKWRKGLEVYGHRPEYFSGSAAYNTMLSNEIDQWRGSLPFYYAMRNISVVTHYQEKAGREIESLLQKYKGKASESCLDYFRVDWKYFIARLKLNFYFHKIGMPTHETKIIPIIDYPQDFFSETDTLLSLPSTYEWCEYYNELVHKTQQFKKEKLSMASAVDSKDNFFIDFFVSQASLKQHPLYYSMAISIDKELRKGATAASKIESYYQDFMRNCTDPLMINRLKTVHDAGFQIAPHQKFPLPLLELVDSSKFDLAKYKGKAICLIFLDGNKNAINRFRPQIEKFDPNEVQFVFARIPVEYHSSGTQIPPDTVLLLKPNVTYLELGDHNIREKLLMSKYKSKIFTLDKWFRIVKDNVEDPKITAPVSAAFEEDVREAINAKRYSKEEKASMYKIIGWSSGSILLTLMIGLVIYKARVRNVRLQEAVKRQIKELEIKAIRSQMNPHFIFNAMNSIQSLINASQYREANIYLSKFATLMRRVLYNSEKGMVPLSDELEAVELYCQLEQLRFEFKFDINVDPAVDASLIEIPGMIIQPLAENAIVHGLSVKKEKGKLDINITRDNGNLCVVISDNGIGLSSQQEDKLKQKGFGLKLAEERMNILSNKGKRASLKLENNTIVTEGTIVTLSIPID